MTRIVFFHPDPAWDGLARVYIELGQALLARGARVAVACPAGSSVAEGAGGLEMLPVDVRGSFFADATRLTAVLRGFRSDAIVVAGDDAHLLAATAVRRTGRGVVVRRVRTGVAAPLGFRTRLAVRFVPTWFMHSSAADAGASEPVRGLRGRFVADLAVDPAPFENVVASPTPIGTSTVAIVIDSHSRRATAAALRTVAALRARGHPMHALLIGTPHDPNEVRVHATALGLGDSVSFVGDPRDRAPLLAAADFVWVAADNDDGGLAALDAMVLARPVIVTRGTMAERYVRHGETGLVTERDDAQASAALIATVQADRTQLTRIGEEARATILASSGLNDAADAMLAALTGASAKAAA